MGFERALLRHDVSEERAKLEAEEAALIQKKAKKSAWGSIGMVLGGLVATAFTGGAAAPWVAAAMAGAGTLGGGFAGKALADKKLGKIDANRDISGGKFFGTQRKTARETYKDADKDLTSSILTEGLKSTITAGVGQYAKNAIAARKAHKAGASVEKVAKIKKGVGLGESVSTSFGGQVVGGAWKKGESFLQKRKLAKLRDFQVGEGLTPVFGDSTGVGTGIAPKGDSSLYDMFAEEYSQSPYTPGKNVLVPSDDVFFDELPKIDIPVDTGFDESSWIQGSEKIAAIDHSIFQESIAPWRPDTDMVNIGGENLWWDDLSDPVRELYQQKWGKK